MLFRMYWRRRRFVFSLVPRCQGQHQRHWEGALITSRINVEFEALFVFGSSLSNSVDLFF
jgi:hypothetical protein